MGPCKSAGPMIEKQTNASSLAAGASILRDEASEREIDQKVLMPSGYMAYLKN